MTNLSSSIVPGSVVVGVDGSHHSDRAVRFAAEQARLEQRRLVVVAADEARPELRLAEDGVALALRAAPEIDAVPLALAGDPRDVLADLSADAHLLVVGSRGRGAVRTLLLGSVSAAVVKTATCPVVVCRPAPDGPTEGVIVGADGSEESLPVIAFAFAQASMRGLPLTVVHCFWDTVAAVAGFREASGEVLLQPELEELRLLLAQSVAGFQEKYPDVPVSLVLRHGLVDEALTRRNSAWDLVVVGRHEMTGLRRTLVGSIANAVVERAHTNVAVVPQDGRS